MSNNTPSDPSAQATLLNTALAYAARGWPILPLHTALKDGCSCRKPDCSTIGKHPRYHATDLRHGLKDASTDEALIRRWWSRWRHANIGIVTGKTSGLVVIDIDPRNGGDLTAEDLETEHGKFPETVENLTGGGGRQLFYQHPGGDRRVSAHTLGPGVDIKADGGYVVAPPSRHASGRRYEWEVSSHPDDITVAPLPPWFPLHEPTPDSQADDTHPHMSEAGDGSPGDDFNQRATAEELRAILTRHGWVVVEHRDGVDYLRRPGKQGRSYSATLGAVAPNVFYCFSTNGHPFEAHHGYKPFSVYGLLTHSGDFKAAAKALADAGYGRLRSHHESSNHDGQAQGIDDEIDITSTPDEAEQDQRDTNARDGDVHHGNQPSDDQSHPNGDGQGPSEPRHIVLPWSDYTNAVRLVKGHGQDLRYCHPWKQWLIYTGQRWIIDDTSEVMRRATRTVKVMAAELQHMDNAQAKAWLHHIKKSLAAPRLNAMISLAESEPPLPITPAQLDANPWLLNCRNGTLDLRTGMFQSHRREDLLTKQIDVDYDPHASCPNWLGFLYRIMGGPSADEDGNEEGLLERHERATSLVAFLQQLVGYSLTGDIAQHILIFLYGTGANGKSTFSETMSAMLGDYFQKAPTQLLMHRDRGGTGTASPEMARLFGSRMVIAAEISEGQRLNEAQVKDLTGGDTIVARHLFKEFFEFRPTHKLWMYGNHKPVIRGTDPGIWRRVHLIPFTVKIPEDEQDPHFREKFLMPELSGILNWAVQGCLDWQRNGLNVPEAVEAATNSYRTEMDVLHHFFNDRCVILRDASVRVSVLYAEYRKWCEANQETILNQRDFSMRVAERGFERNRGAQGYHYWRGIGVFTPPGGDEAR
jgi:P4 family phage/plasmid primase-like protien